MIETVGAWSFAPPSRAKISDNFFFFNYLIKKNKNVLVIMMRARNTSRQLNITSFFIRAACNNEITRYRRSCMGRAPVGITTISRVYRHMVYVL